MLNSTLLLEIQRKVEEIMEHGDVDEKIDVEGVDIHLRRQVLPRDLDSAVSRDRKRRRRRGHSRNVEEHRVGERPGATELEPAANIDRAQRRGDAESRLCAPGIDVDGGRALEGLEEVETNSVNAVALRWPGSSVEGHGMADHVDSNGGVVESNVEERALVVGVNMHPGQGLVDQRLEVEAVHLGVDKDAGPGGSIGELNIHVATPANAEVV